MQSPCFVRTCSSIAALTVLIWDSLINFEDEYEHIWQLHTGLAKRIYIFSRYYGICWHIIDCAAMLGPLASIGTRPLICAIWHGSKLFTGLWLLVALEVVLAIRLYALYCKDRSIGIFLAVLLGTGLAVTVTCYVRTTRRVQFDEACLLRKTPYEYVYFSTFCFMRHALLWTLTMHKRNVGRLGHLHRAPIVHLMLRDGAWIFAGITVLLAALVPSSFLRPANGQAMFPWFTSLVSIFTCRLVLNMQRLQIETTSSVHELTTNVSEPASDLHCL
ncbi:hypothetical protein LshimejAT787_0605770 [Lyophyllum shimeji]|uniref:DUF6533 domain-containing protein n=1 Tax=Lyophyllum shimeji TaxID=47721 RepID=A0A9P3UPU3_LYOSH|nr:hypothetical protein LshimejAT787_0605770 [Lyophyllum shimeji]